MIRIFECNAFDLDFSFAIGIARRNHRVWFYRSVHQVAEPRNGQARLLKLLPKTDQAQHRLRQSAGKHLECDEHADGEFCAPHNRVCPDGEDQETQYLFEQVGDGVVGIAELSGCEAGGQIAGKISAVLAVQLRFQLQ